MQGVIGGAPRLREAGGVKRCGLGRERGEAPPKGRGGEGPSVRVPSCVLAAMVAVQSGGCAAQAVMEVASRAAPLARSRQLAMYLAHVVLGLTQGQVARGFRRDRRTVAHACRCIEERRDDPAFDAHVAGLEARLRWVVAA